MAKELVWIDLEMTGLNPQIHRIIEIATIITDSELNIIAKGPDLVISASDEELSKMNSYVTEMHTKSGLIEEVKKSELATCITKGHLLSQSKGITRIFGDYSLSDDKKRIETIGNTTLIPNSVIKEIKKI